MTDEEWKDAGAHKIGTVAAMEAIAKGLDTVLNGTDAVEGDAPRKTGFVLLLFPFDKADDGRTNYVSNIATREQVTKMFEEQLRVFKEESPDQRREADE